MTHCGGGEHWLLTSPTCTTPADVLLMAFTACLFTGVVTYSCRSPRPWWSVLTATQGHLAAVRNALLAPGAFLHECAHVIVARRYGTVTVEWGLVRSTMRIEWNDRVPVWGVVGVYFAPPAAAGILAIAAAGIVEQLAGLPLWVHVYLAIQFALLAGPSGIDIMECLHALQPEADAA